MNQDNKTQRLPTYKKEDFLAEMVYNQTKENTKFAIKRKGESVEYAPRVKTDEKQILPLSPDNDLLTANVLRFPSSATKFESEEKLIKEIQEFIHQYLDVSQRFERIAPYYILMTWMYDKFNEIPYLRALGDYGSGKTRFLQTIGSICYKPTFAGGSTTVSPIFRMMNKIDGTLILDEADYRFSNKTVDMVKILNSGYSKGMPLMRTEGRGNYSVKAFKVFGPKIVASKERYQDKALESRFIVEQMGQTKMRDDIPLNLDEDFRKKAQNLRNKLLYWRLENYHCGLKGDQENINADVHPRLQQISLPLLTIIDEKKAERALCGFFKDHNEKLVHDRQNSLPGQIFLAILKLKTKDYSKFKVKNIADTYNSMQENGESIPSRKAGYILREKLQLDTKRGNGGNYYLYTSEHKERIKVLKEKYGFSEESTDSSEQTSNSSSADVGEQVNVLNFAGDKNKDGNEITKDDLPF